MSAGTEQRAKVEIHPPIVARGVFTCLAFRAMMVGG
jgi:hypothetical protein